MRLTVLSVAYPFARVGFHCVGGAEQILTELDDALVAAGHSSLVLARHDSTAAGELFPLPCFDSSVEDEEQRRCCRKHVQMALDEVLSKHRVDLVHMHGIDFYEYRLPSHVPVLVTIHLPVSWYPPGIWRQLPSNVWLQCVSEHQRLFAPPELRSCPVIGNGVDVSLPLREKLDFAMVLGRICPEKNQHAALEAGFLAGIRVILGGEVFPWPEHEAYFREKVEPLVQQECNGIRHKFQGPLDAEKKEQLLGQARCLLHPTLAPETSSLVAMEALAAGTPVIAYRSGALAEIVDDGVTGFLVSGVEEMVEAIHRVHTINQEVCRAAARRRFSKERMVAQYFDLYAELLGSPIQERLSA
jgi:glycosyltransferase involved in cell wall biosynthesis